MAPKLEFYIGLKIRINGNAVVKLNAIFKSTENSHIWKLVTMPYCDYSLQGVGDGSRVIQQETEITALSVIGHEFVIFIEKTQVVSKCRFLSRSETLFVATS